jgi:hypothetical protein
MATIVSVRRLFRQTGFNFVKRFLLASAPHLQFDRATTLTIAGRIKSTDKEISDAKDHAIFVV